MDKGDFTDASMEAIRTSYGRPKRNGQTAAYCTSCGEEIKGVAYVVETRDAGRLLDGGVRSSVLHYDCIAAAYQPSEARE